MLTAMLSMAKVAHGRWAYYLSTVASGSESPEGLVEPDGTWIGRGAADLLLGQVPVDAAHLGALLEGVDPATGEVLDPRHDRVRVAAFDCTFAAPKSVSLVHALGADDVVAHLRAAHEASVTAAMGYLEDEAARVRRRGGGVDRVEPAEGLCAAAFLHRTSRAPDPHLHTHVLVANLGSDRAGRWSALDGRALYVHLATAAVLYRSQLRAELVRRLDVAWRWRDDGFAELAGLQPEALRAFSRRRNEIVAALEAQGRSGAGAARIAAARSRRDKDTTVAYVTLVTAWREQAHAAGISDGAVARVTPGRAVRPMSASRPGIDAWAPEVVDGPFSRRGLLQARAQSLRDGASVVSVVGDVDAHLRSGLLSGAIAVDAGGSSGLDRLRHRSGRLIPSAVRETRFVTRDFLDLERRLSRRLSDAAVLVSSREPVAPGIFVLGASGTAPFATLEALRAAVDTARRDGRQVTVAAPGGPSQARLEALTGVEVVDPAAATSGRGSLLVVGDADRWGLSALARAIDDADAMSSSLVVVAAPGGGARMSIVRALARGSAALVGGDISQVERSGGGCAASAARIEAEDFAVRLVARVPDVVDALAEEHLLQRQTYGHSVVVVTDAAVARELDAATSGEVRALTAGELATAQPAGSRVPLVVLGGMRTLGRAQRPSEGAPRCHVAVGPPAMRDGRDHAEQDALRWATYLARGRTAPARERARSLAPGSSERALGRR